MSLFVSLVCYLISFGTNRYSDGWRAGATDEEKSGGRRSSFNDDDIQHQENDLQDGESSSPPPVVLPQRPSISSSAGASPSKGVSSGATTGSTTNRVAKIRPNVTTKTIDLGAAANYRGDDNPSTGGKNSSNSIVHQTGSSGVTLSNADLLSDLITTTEPSVVSKIVTTGDDSEFADFSQFSSSNSGGSSAHHVTNKSADDEFADFASAFTGLNTTTNNNNNCYLEQPKSQGAAASSASKSLFDEDDFFGPTGHSSLPPPVASSGVVPSNFDPFQSSSASFNSNMGFEPLVPTVANNQNNGDRSNNNKVGSGQMGTWGNSLNSINIDVDNLLGQKESPKKPSMNQLKQNFGS